jgi:unsaturated chondroitin disaccharide hydrolase
MLKALMRFALFVAVCGCSSEPAAEGGHGGTGAVAGQGGTGAVAGQGGTGADDGGVPTTDQLVDHALDFAESQLEASVAELVDASRYPEAIASGGSWGTTDRTGWTSGFFPGCLWLMHEHTGRADFRTWAEGWTIGLDAQKTDTTSHDLGFQILCSYGQGHRIAQVGGYSDVMLTAASSLDTRFNPTVGCIRSWSWGSWSFPVIIDNMMNLELLLWAAKNGGAATLSAHALSHTTQTIKNHVRADDTTYHLVDYDPNTGAVLWQGHYQGFSDESTWARGMAWGIYGMTMTYRYSSDATALGTAVRLADWFISHLPADHVPYWDFEAPNIPNEPRDTSAAAIVASALQELAVHVSDASKSAVYRSEADAIIRSLCSNYLTEGTPSSAIVKDAYYVEPRSAIFGDYYFLEALLRYKRGLEWQTQ